MPGPCFSQPGDRLRLPQTIVCTTYVHKHRVIQPFSEGSHNPVPVPVDAHNSMMQHKEVLLYILRTRPAGSSARTRHALRHRQVFRAFRLRKGKAGEQRHSTGRFGHSSRRSGSGCSRSSRYESETETRGFGSRDVAHAQSRPVRSSYVEFPPLRSSPRIASPERS